MQSRIFAVESLDVVAVPAAVCVTLPAFAGHQARGNAEIRGVAQEGIAALNAGDFVECGQRAVECGPGCSAGGDHVFQREEIRKAARLIVVEANVVAGNVVVIQVAVEDVEERDKFGPGAEMNGGKSSAADFNDAIAPLAKQVGVGC